MREAAWALHLSFSVLTYWNQGFDESMQPFNIPDNRGKTAKVTVQMVGEIVRAAKSLKTQGKRLRLQGFTRMLATEHGIVLSRKKVREILIANNLFAAQTRKRRPKFYQSLRNRIPNGLLSIDGSEFIVWLDDEAYKFNVELAVDVGTFSHTAFSIADTETSLEVIKVLEDHRKHWGCPVGILCDHGSANLSESTRAYIREQGIELVPVGPANPKGNGSDEGAFSQMKQVMGNICLDLSSPRALAKSVLQKIISVYIHMRNRLVRKASFTTPIEGMTTPVSEHQRDLERQRIKDHNKAKAGLDKDQSKLDRLHRLIRYHGIRVEPQALKRAERSIKSFEMEVITASEEAFIKAISRKADRMNLPYFFGILKRIQQEKDDAAYKRYCHERYNHQVMSDIQRCQQQQQDKNHTVSGIVAMLEHAVTDSVQFVKELAARKAFQWTQELAESYRYPGTLKKQFADALGELKHLSLDQKNKAWELIEQFLNTKTNGESVTLSS